MSTQPQPDEQSANQSRNVLIVGGVLGAVVIVLVVLLVICRRNSRGLSGGGNSAVSSMSTVSYHEFGSAQVPTLNNIDDLMRNYGNNLY